MTARVTAQLARTSGTTLCTRCMDVIDVVAGRWHPAEHDATHHAVCDHCSETHDPQGHTTLLAWRRAANSPATGTRGRS